MKKTSYCLIGCVLLIVLCVGGCAKNTTTTSSGDASNVSYNNDKDYKENTEGENHSALSEIKYDTIEEYIKSDEVQNIVSYSNDADGDFETTLTILNETTILKEITCHNQLTEDDIEQLTDRFDYDSALMDEWTFNGVNLFESIPNKVENYSGVFFLEIRVYDFDGSIVSSISGKKGYSF